MKAKTKPSKKPAKDKINCEESPAAIQRKSRDNALKLKSHGSLEGLIPVRLDKRTLIYVTKAQSSNHIL